ncbi:MAG: hypothetical protein CL532_10940 [Aestuariivita sp.]|nr:hypothetical protein [Aestuariivita sp.]
MILILRLIAVILVLSIIFFTARKMISLDKTDKIKVISFRSLLKTILATVIAMLSFVVAAEIITRM